MSFGGDKAAFGRRLDEIRRRVSLEGLVGRTVKLRKTSGGKVGLCPFHSEKTPSFHVSDTRGSYHCFGCGAHGDIFTWVMEVSRVDFAGAVRLLADDAAIDAGAPVQREAPAREECDAELVDTAEAGCWLWSRAIPARNTLVERYFVSRGLRPMDLLGALDHLRFLAAAPVVPWRRGQRPDSVRSAPAMVGAMRDEEGEVRGVHLTYLATDGRGKADFGRDRNGRTRPARKMWGALQGHAVWLSAPDAAGPLVVGEGIETVLAFAQRAARPCRMAAALSLDNLQGGFERGPQGCWPLWRMRADPARPPFLVERPGDVILLIDADMKLLRDVRVQRERGGGIERGEIDGLVRARICAELASGHWRRAGAESVSAVRPPAGMDFNDLERAG